MVIDFKKELETMEEMGLVCQRTNPRTGEMGYYLTKDGWLYGQYQKVICGESVPEETLKELRKRIKI